MKGFKRYRRKEDCIVSTFLCQCLISNPKREEAVSDIERIRNYKKCLIFVSSKTD
jgi:hypothetical protein